MKYPVLIIIAALALGSCNKQKSQPTNFQILTTHTWYLKYQVTGAYNDTTPCTLSQVLTLSKDSTGNFSYTDPCDSAEAKKLPFRWYIENNTTVVQYYMSTILSTTLYTNNIGNKDSSTVLRLSTIGMDTLKMNGDVNNGSSYTAIYTSSK
jgi:hypothetical protein